MSRILLAIAAVALIVSNALWLRGLRSSEVATAGHRRHILGQLFIALMIVSALVLGLWFGPTVRDVAAICFGLVGIGLLFSTDK